MSLSLRAGVVAVFSLLAVAGCVAGPTSDEDADSQESAAPPDDGEGVGESVEAWQYGGIPAAPPVGSIGVPSAGFGNGPAGVAGVGSGYGAPPLAGYGPSAPPGGSRCSGTSCQVCSCGCRGTGQGLPGAGRP
jgi:hypothetical protein